MKVKNYKLARENGRGRHVGGRIYEFGRGTLVVDAMEIHGIRFKCSVKEGSQALFVEMPKRRDGRGGWVPIANPIKGDKKNYNAIIQAFQRAHQEALTNPELLEIPGT